MHDASLSVTVAHTSAVVAGQNEHVATTAGGSWPTCCDTLASVFTSQPQLAAGTRITITHRFERTPPRRPGKGVDGTVHPLDPSYPGDRQFRRWSRTLTSAAALRRAARRADRSERSCSAKPVRGTLAPRRVLAQVE